MKKKIGKLKIGKRSQSLFVTRKNQNVIPICLCPDDEGRSSA